MTNHEARGILEMSRRLDRKAMAMAVRGASATHIKFDSAKVKPFITDDKQLPAGWDDEDNAEFECEFFEFLQERGGLDEYIDIRSYVIRRDLEFKLPSSPNKYVSFIFDCYEAITQYWHDMDKLWSLKLETLTNLKQTK
jgi:hypothetical protein